MFLTYMYTIYVCTTYSWNNQYVHRSYSVEICKGVVHPLLLAIVYCFLTTYLEKWDSNMMQILAKRNYEHLFIRICSSYLECLWYFRKTKNRNFRNSFLNCHCLMEIKISFIQQKIVHLSVSSTFFKLNKRFLPHLIYFSKGIEQFITLFWLKQYICTGTYVKYFTTWLTFIHCEPEVLFYMSIF